LSASPPMKPTSGWSISWTKWSLPVLATWGIRRLGEAFENTTFHR
jgi:hypothetical protein